MILCGWCGEPASGYACINETRYCHDGESPTCYELASHDHVLELADRWGMKVTDTGNGWVFEPYPSVDVIRPSEGGGGGSGSFT